MAKFEALIEINPEKVEILSEYVAYCKFYFKPKSEEKIKNYQNLEDLKRDFRFVNENIINNSKFKNNTTLKDFPLNWLKYKVTSGDINRVLDFNHDESIQQIKQISGIFENIENLQNYIQKLPQYSFAIWVKLKLKAPYFSKDDDEFYIIQNPILKETNFKVPMVRGSGWKGALAHAFRKLFEEETDIDNKKAKIESFLRIFGAGSESIKAIENYILDKTKNLEKAREKLLEFILFELGLKVDKILIDKLKKITNKKEFITILQENLSKKLENIQNNFSLEFQTHKGRAVFYPTYFDKLSLEIINPHDRRKRAGTNPIHYEVVPPETEGIFQLIYTPFDGILKNDEKLKEEVNEDLKNLCNALEILSNKGIGAKTKLGGGRFEIADKMICVNEDLSIPEGWEICQS